MELDPTNTADVLQNLKWASCEDLESLYTSSKPE